MLDIVRAFLPRAVQDLIVAFVGTLAAHGYITADQTQSTVGSLFFLAMLVANYFLSQHSKANAAQIGAEVTGTYLPRADAISIAKKGSIT
jgi:hypothetical protein